ncbi:endoribonuclease L-PSP [Mesorhizobium loti]|nr:endoribonuclease L-PSP [Mesorhizobium loti]
MRRETITTDRIAPPVGPFSAAVRAGDLLFLSGQVALDPATRKLVAGDIGAQTEQIFANISSVLEAAGKSFDDVMKANVYLTDMKEFGAMNTVYARYFRTPYPARTTIQVAGLPLGAAVEIEVVAR